MAAPMRLAGVSVLAVTCALGALAGRNARPAKTGKASSVPAGRTYAWKKTDHSLALLLGGKTLWRFNYEKKQGKPYFHPLALRDGTVLTDLRPKDHPWHRGLWFSWKFINGLNYWEEDRETGLSQGRTEITNVKVTANDDYSAKIEMELSYHPPKKPAALTEKRALTVSAPDKKGQYRIDWRSTFTAGQKDAMLDRTPIKGEKGGQSWGGYAGLSLRMAAGTRCWRFIDSEDREGAKNIHGKNARWVDFSGDAGGVAVLDHASNMRCPSAWYVGPKMPYFGPALLFNKPYTLTAGKSFTLWYRILVHSGRGDPKALADEWYRFCRPVKLPY